MPRWPKACWSTSREWRARRRGSCSRGTGPSRAGSCACGRRRDACGSALDRALFLACEPVLVAVGRVRRMRRIDLEESREQVGIFAEREGGVEQHGPAAPEGLPQLEVGELAAHADVLERRGV